MDSAAWDARYAAAPDLMWTAEPNRFLVAELAGLPPGRVLDLAAGEGRNAVWLAERGWRATAVEFSAVAVERGRSLAATRGVEVDWVLADLRGYQPPAGGFEAVLVLYLHLPATERAAVLARAAAAVAPGGMLLVVGHDRTNLTDGVGGPQDPAILHAPAEIAAELPGLDIVRAETVRRPVQVDGGTGRQVPQGGIWRDALDTLVRAVRVG